MAVTAADIRDAISADSRLARHIAHIQISSRRTTLGMSMKPGDAGITVHVPATAQPSEVVTLLGRNRDRIGAMLVKAHEHTPDHPVKQFVGGTGFLWLGRSNRLRLVDNPPATLRHVNDHGQESERGTWCGRWFELDRTALPHGAKPFIDWYTREGTVWLTRETPQWWFLMAPRRPMPTVRAADIGRSRWGVYDGTTHTIRVAWQTLQLQPRLIRHVLVYELVHATHPAGKPHGPAFWRTFERTMPGARQDQQELTRAGRHIWMGDTA